MRPSGRALGGGLLAAGLLAGAVTWAVARDDGAGTTAPITTSSTAAVAVVGQPGARGVGDPYFPELGNGGYDVDRYDLDLTWRPATGVLEGVATITATATQDLSSFDLDLSGMAVRSVRVDGTGVAFTRDAAELVITPAVAIAAGERFTTTVAYDGAPKGIVGADAFSVGWQTFGPEVFVASEPEGAATFFPVNDHPSDKATYRFEVTAPSELTVATNGVALEHTTAGDGTTTWESEAREPMASYLVQVAIGEFAVVDGGASRSGVPIRHVVHRDHQAEATAALARTAEMIDVLEGVWGPYPFAVYGVLSVPIPLGFALETQTLTLIGQDTIADPRGLLTLVHELAHQWTGDAVSPATWKDIWLNEGFATYSEWLWTERTGGEPASAQARGIQALGLDTPPGDPGVAGLFGPAVYQRGALALQALREEVGDDVFFRTLRAWVDEHTGRSVSTMDLIALAERESGRELDALFDTWLYQQRLPRLDG